MQNDYKNKKTKKQKNKREYKSKNKKIIIKKTHISFWPSALSFILLSVLLMGIRTSTISNIQCKTKWVIYLLISPLFSKNEIVYTAVTKNEINNLYSDLVRLNTLWMMAIKIN